MASADCSARAPCWQHLGRSTPAGRRLYNLFCTDQGGRRVGNSFSERNRALGQLHAARRAADASAGAASHTSPQCAQPAAKPRPGVRAPRFQRPARRAPSAAPPRGRRPAHSILAEARAAQARALAAGPPAPRPGLGDAEKERLALLMQFGGELPAGAGTQGVGGACARAPRRGLQSELHLLLEQARMEVQERRERLAELPGNSCSASPFGMNRQACAQLAEADALRRDLAGRLAELRRVSALVATCSAEA